MPDTIENTDLASLTLSKLDLFAHPGGCAWTATLSCDGEPLCVVDQRGDGGSNMYRPLPGAGGNGPAFRAAMAHWTDVAKEATGLKFEPLDALLAHMENGDTAASAVPKVIAERKEYGY